MKERESIEKVRFITEYSNNAKVVLFVFYGELDPFIMQMLSNFLSLVSEQEWFSFSLFSSLNTKYMCIL